MRREIKCLALDGGKQLIITTDARDTFAVLQVGESFDFTLYSVFKRDFEVETLDEARGIILGDAKNIIISGIGEDCRTQLFGDSAEILTGENEREVKFTSFGEKTFQNGIFDHGDFVNDKNDMLIKSAILNEGEKLLHDDAGESGSNTIAKFGAIKRKEGKEIVFDGSLKIGRVDGFAEYGDHIDFIDEGDDGRDGLGIKACFDFVIFSEEKFK